MTVPLMVPLTMVPLVVLMASDHPVRLGAFKDKPCNSRAGQDNSVAALAGVDRED